MGKAAALLLVLTLLAVSCAFTFMPVNAAPRTIVVPDDYSTIESAIANDNNGDTIFVREGIYESPINHTLIIIKQ